jgi:hypothetical protein
VGLEDEIVALLEELTELGVEPYDEFLSGQAG